MAYVKTPKDTERDRLIRQTGGQPLSSIPSAAPAVSAPSSATPESRRQSGRFTGIQKYIAANKDAGDTMAKKVAGNIQAQAQGVQEDVLSAGQQFREKAEAADKPYFTEADKAIEQRYFSSPTYRTPDSAEAKRLKELSEVQYKGPGSIDLSELKARGERAIERSKQLGTEEGRFIELQKTYERPDYQRGQQKLDQLLLQTSDPAKGRFAATAQDIQSRLPGLATQVEQNVAQDVAARSARLEQQRKELYERLTGQKAKDLESVQLEALKPTLAPEVGTTAPVKPQQPVPETPKDFVGIPVLPGNIVAPAPEQIQPGTTQAEIDKELQIQRQQVYEKAAADLDAYDKQFREPIPANPSMQDPKVKAWFDSLPPTQKDQWMQLINQVVPESLEATSKHREALRNFMSKNNYGVKPGPEREALVNALTQAQQAAQPQLKDTNTYVSADIMKQIESSLPPSMVNDQVEIRDEAGNLLYKGSSTLINHIKRYGIDPVAYFYQKGQSSGVDPVVERSRTEEERQRILKEYEQKQAQQTEEEKANIEIQENAFNDTLKAIEQRQQELGRELTVDEKEAIFQQFKEQHTQTYQQEKVAKEQQKQQAIQQGSTAYKQALTQKQQLEANSKEIEAYILKVQDALNKHLQTKFSSFNKPQWDAKKAELEGLLNNANQELATTKQGIEQTNQQLAQSQQALSEVDKYFDVAQIKADQIQTPQERQITYEEFKTEPVDFFLEKADQIVDENSLRSNYAEEKQAYDEALARMTPQQKQQMLVRPFPDYNTWKQEAMSSRERAGDQILKVLNRILQNPVGTSAAQQSLFKEAIASGLAVIDNGKIRFTTPGETGNSITANQAQSYQGLVDTIKTRVDNYKKAVEADYKRAADEIQIGKEISGDIAKAIFGKDKGTIPNIGGVNISDFLIAAPIPTDDEIMFQVMRPDEYELLNSFENIIPDFQNPYKTSNPNILGTASVKTIFDASAYKAAVNQKFKEAYDNYKKNNTSNSTTIAPQDAFNYFNSEKGSGSLGTGTGISKELQTKMRKYKDSSLSASDLRTFFNSLTNEDIHNLSQKNFSYLKMDGKKLLNSFAQLDKQILESANTERQALGLPKFNVDAMFKSTYGGAENAKEAAVKILQNAGFDSGFINNALSEYSKYGLNQSNPNRELNTLYVAIAKARSDILTRISNQMKFDFNVTAFGGGKYKPGYSKNILAPIKSGKITIPTGAATDASDPRIFGQMKA